MALNFDTLWPLVQQAGLPGVVVALLVLVFVFLAQFTNLLKYSWMRRAAVVILSYLFAGAPGGNVLESLVFAIGAVVATLSHLLLGKLFALAQAQMAANTQTVAKK